MISITHAQLLLTALGVVFCGVCASSAAELSRVVAENIDPDPGPVGEPFYEMDGRKEERKPLVTFDDVQGWIVESQNAEAHLYRSQDHRLYDRSYVGKLDYQGKPGDSSVLVRPERPIPIPDPEWNAVNFWTHGYGILYRPNVLPWPEVRVVVRDAVGTELEMPSLGHIDYVCWFMMRAQWPRDRLAQLKRPLSLVGFRFRPLGTTKRIIYLGPCYFYKDDFQSRPLVLEKWPRKLPFPTREETILPVNKTKRFRTTVNRSGDATEFRYRGSDVTMTYRYTPRTGTLSDLELLYDGKIIHPCNGGDIDPAESGENLQRTLAEQSLAGGVLTARWHLQGSSVAGELVYRIRLRQKSLVVELESDTPVIQRLMLGRIVGLSSPQSFRIPFLSFDTTHPRVVYGDGLFLFTMLDWYHSDASEWFGPAADTADAVNSNGGAVYIPKTDGQRNCLRERLFITASPDFHEVLPSIPNPASPFQKEQGDRVWLTHYGSLTEELLREHTRLRSYGVDKVTMRYHEQTWHYADRGSATFRVHAHPLWGGDKAVRELIEAEQRLGWRVALYSNFTDFSPVNSFWNEDWLLRRPDGNWLLSWIRNYAPKPMIGVQMQPVLASQIHATFGTDASYCDVATAVTPWSRTDYDARVPGAGTFRRSFESYGRILLNEKKTYRGPVLSEGNYHWMYAGLSDGNYAQMPNVDLTKEPMRPDFDLLKIHPLEMDAGLSVGFEVRNASDVDRQLSRTIAYGHVGNFGTDQRTFQNLAQQIKYYYMIQPVQSSYAMVPVREIAYEQDGKLIDPSQALITGAYKRNRLRVMYTNGTTIYVNDNAEPWTLLTPHGESTLPSSGWIVWNSRSGLLQYSAIVSTAGSTEKLGDHRRVDFSASEGKYYVDSRGGFAFLGPLATEGSAVLIREKSEWRVIPTTDCVDFAFDPALLGGQAINSWKPTRRSANQSVQVQAIAEDGTILPPAEVRWSRGLLHILQGPQPAFQFRLGRSTWRALPEMKSDTTLAVQGQPVNVTLPRDSHVDTSQIFWEWNKQKTPANASCENQILVVRAPSTAEPGAHLWLGVPGQQGTNWIDFLAVEPVGLRVPTHSPKTVNRGQSIQIPFELVNRQRGSTTASVECEVSAGSFRVLDRREVFMPGQTCATNAFSLALPRRSERYNLRARSICDRFTNSVITTLTVAIEDDVVADLANPEMPFNTSYCLRGGKEQPTTYSTHDGQFYVATASCGGIARSGFYVHPPWGESRAGFTVGHFRVDLPDRPTFFRFYTGIKDGTTTSDGVTYKVVVIQTGDRRTEVFSEHVTACQWESRTIDLSAFRGQTIQLQLISDCGPKDDTTADNSLWGQPRIVSDEEQMTVRISFDQEAR